MSAGRSPANLLRLYVLFQLLIIAALHAEPAADITSLKKLSLEELSHIEVTSPAKTPVQASRVPMAIFVITSEDIRRSGVTSIPEALRLAPGVEVARINSNQWSVGIRGFGSRLARSLLVLIDGRTVYTTLFAGVYWEVQDTLLDDIDRIEVIRGPGGTIWGPNAVNGVINIITKHSRDTRGMLATLASGNLDQAYLQYRYGGGRGSTLNYRLYGKAFTRGPQYHYDRANYDDWRSAQAGFRIDWDRRDGDQLTFQGDLYKQEVGQSTNLLTYESPFSRQVEQEGQLSGGNVNVRWTRSLWGDSTLQLQTFYDRTRRDEANFGETRDTGDIDFVVRHGVRARQRFSWGAGARASHGAGRQIISGVFFSPLTRTDYLLTGFVQDEIEIVPDRLSLTVGTKLLRTNFARFETEPSARLMWTPTRNHSAWAAFTRAVRTPSRVERELSLLLGYQPAPGGVPSFGRLDPTPTFETEKMNGYEAGFRHLFGEGVYVDLAAFHNRYDDLLSQHPGATFLETTPAPAHLLSPRQVGNELFGATTGYEIAPEWRPTELWRLRGSYSYLVMDLHTWPGRPEFGTAERTENTSPRHQAVVQSALTFPKFEVDLAYRFVSSLPSRFPTFNIPRYSTADARVGWRIRPELDISLVGRNLLQPRHREFGGSGVAIRRAVYARVTWSY